MGDPPRDRRVVSDPVFVGVQRAEGARDPGEGHDVRLGHGPAGRGELQARLEVVEVHRHRGASWFATRVNTGSGGSACCGGQVTSTAASHANDSTGASTIRVDSRTPSSSSTIANTYGQSAANSGLVLR